MLFVIERRWNDKDKWKRLSEVYASREAAHHMIDMMETFTLAEYVIEPLESTENRILTLNSEGGLVQV